MKGLFLFLFLLVVSFTHSQTTLISDSIEFYFLKSLNEHRKNLYGDSVVMLTINDNASLACKHHNEYLFNMVWINKVPNQKKVFLSHGESQKSTTNDGAIFEYKGKAQLIPNFADRIRYYNTNKDFGPVGEVIYVDGVRPSNVIQAEKTLKGFLDSPAHKEILENPDYEYIAIDIKVQGSFVSTVIVTGTSPGNGLTFNGH